MNTKSGTSEPFDTFLESYLHELIATPDAEILEGTTANAAQEAGLKLLSAAKARAGKRRMAVAQEGIANKATKLAFAKPVVSPAVARAYLARLSHDSHMTLAARNIADLSDDDVLRIYGQVKELEAQNQGSQPDDTIE
jgi:hypothetical protein